MSEWYQSMAKHHGFTRDYAFVGEPETNGVIERFNRTWQEHVASPHLRDIGALRAALADFIAKCNAQWRIERL